MYLRSIRVQRLKLLRDLRLDFTAPDGETIRKWTVIIGQNGTAKTSLLQAVALAAAGGLQVNTLAGRSIGHLRDRRSADPMEIDATFEFIDKQTHPALHPQNKGEPPDPLALRSQVTLARGETTIRAKSAYAHAPRPARDPLDDARSRNTPRWFVAGYGVARFLPDVGRAITLDRPSIERMMPLFDPTTALASTGFSSYFGQEEKARRFHRVLKHALLNVASLLPDITDLELRGYGGVTRPGDLLERDRFSQRVGTGEPLKVPGVALAHGYQSTIAWVADLVGHVLLEAEKEIEPEDMEGLVLVDEIDLFLHPVWQATLVPALRATFPKMQFIVTTHSPVVLSRVAPHEVVRLASWGDAGDVVEVVHDPGTGELVPALDAGGDGVRPDARMMTGSEIFRDHFGLEGSTPNPMGDELRKYTMLATDPFRTQREHEEALRLRDELTRNGFTELPALVRRRKA
jgi:AAA domain, putative AbiEii toxin, Type IV TA system